MAQAFWDENKQHQRKMEQLEQELIDFLKRNNIKFKVDGNVVKIEGDVVIAELSGYEVGPENITIVQGDKKIKWDSYMEESVLQVGGLRSPGYSNYITLPRDISVHYNKPYLLIVF